MRDFARRLAAKGSAAMPESTGRPLHEFARNLREKQEAQLEYALKEMNQLAADMQSFAAIPRGACVP
jgi:hypothetical protein